MNNTEREKRNRIIWVFSTIVGFIIASTYVALFAMYWGTSRVASGLLLINGFFIFVPSFFCFVAGLVTMIVLLDWR
ncbi:hypothetical protein A8C46_00320 [Ligilactobacillus salivarius]|uniref:Uncharacterized protein n=2 Tax=Ligilactobacillus salivarius TaxID=1624 RepID=A0A9X6S939_9LACO|nr:hypothetical protein [Ligilactobacillus salivarius]OTF89758.1 hypothetical protein A8C38_00320 [Ligilactobacillus salivarius]PAY43592.1 hypothetical protein A8C39_00500 [Ligilactobacillus salivarius]PAY49407.1 hypothetical protein A8C42_00650 [Ligilactobacillus salivarius]PAY50155.1 hypothetical protein A8C52_11735 [Ligilactobacillus salivarius]PAY58048.1 hypothetical protein A8C46_00320 [Ligilactobacillus salivarius]